MSSGTVKVKLVFYEFLKWMKTFLSTVCINNHGCYDHLQLLCFQHHFNTTGLTKYDHIMQQDNAEITLFSFHYMTLPLPDNQSKLCFGFERKNKSLQIVGSQIVYTSSFFCKIGKNDKFRDLAWQANLKTIFILGYIENFFTKSNWQ